MSRCFSPLVQIPSVRGYIAEQESLGCTPKFCPFSSAQVVAKKKKKKKKYCYVMLQLYSPSSKMLFLPQPFLPFLPLITTKKMALTSYVFP